MLGGTGVIGRAVSRRLTEAGWRVDAVARGNRDGLPEVVRADRHDAAALAAVVGSGADLLVDCLCYTARDAELILPLLESVTAAVVMSARAVYVDEAGNHLNADTAPNFEEPVTEQQPTLAPSRTADFNSRDGYARCKVAAEQVLLDSGRPVTILRASKVHGAGSPRPVSEFFVERVLNGEDVLRLTHPGYADHLTAARNVAHLVEIVAANPGARVLNVADADVPTRAHAAEVTADFFHHGWTIVEDEAAPQPPWGQRRPLVLDTSAAQGIGYRPETFAATIGAELGWLAAAAQIR